MLLNACKDIGLAVNKGKTKYMEIGRHRGMIANAQIKIRSNSYEKVKTFKYLGSSSIDQNYIQDEIKCRLKAGISCYYSVQTLLSSRLLSKQNIHIKIILIRPVINCINSPNYKVSKFITKILKEKINLKNKFTVKKTHLN